MTALIIIMGLMMGSVRAIVELDCSDNATCIDHMVKEVVRSLKQQKSVRMFDVLTIEPLSRRQARSTDWLTGFLEGHAFSYDWNDYTFRVSRPDDSSNVLDLEIYQGRTAKDVSDPNAKKSSSKAEEESEEDKTPKHKLGLRRRHKKKVMQVILPLLFGMKTTGIVMFGFALVAALTMKAFVASKIALMVTAGMAMKKLYETYGSGVGLQNHPYLYSQYPIDFPSASSHAYPVASGVSPQFASPEMYSPTAMGNNPHANEILHHSDATAQQSQQAPTLINNTRAAERWDGKSKLQQLLEPIVSTFRNAISPIANAFYGAMPATFRGLNSDVSTAKSIENEIDVEIKPKEILMAQPRNYVQRKMTRRKYSTRPKKYTELNISLDRLKDNKDLHDYIKTKKYKYNYPNTYFYPRIKYFVNPNSFYKPNNSKLTPYKKEASSTTVTVIPLITNNSDWRPIIPLNRTSFQENITRSYRNASKKPYKNRTRSKRSITDNENISIDTSKRLYTKQAARGFFDLVQFLFTSDPLNGLVNFTDDYAKTVIEDRKKTKEPGFYTFAHKLVMMSLDVIDGISMIHDALTTEPKGKRKVKRKQTSKCTDRSN